MRATRTRMVLTAGLLAVCSIICLSAAGSAQELDEAALRELNRAIFLAQIVARDAAPLEANALSAFRVVAPGGLVENKDQAMSGVASFNAASIMIDEEEVIREGPTAIVIGRIVVDGEMRPVGRLGPMRFMSVFVWSDGEWRLLARSMTPCAEMLQRLGRC